MRTTGLALIVLGLVALRHARAVPVLLRRQQNTAHQEMLAAAAARRRARR